MKLILRRTEAPSVPGGFAFLLCDEQGEMLPMQTSCVVDCSIGEASITVEFHVDGDEIRIAE